MATHKEFYVDLIVTTEHRYLILARTSEEATSLAEDLYDDGEEGDVLSVSIEHSDATSVDERMEPEDFEAGFIE